LETTPTPVAFQHQTPATPGLFGGISSFFTNLVSGILGNPKDPVIGTWDIIPGNLTMRFDADGTAILRDPATGYHAAGRWETAGEDQYRLISATGARSPVLGYDPIGDALFTGDFSVVFLRRAEP
jgi:hypothetical protein